MTELRNCVIKPITAPEGRDIAADETKQTVRA